MNSKVRLVKCPRCRKVLPEPPDVPVYACGGCGAKLEAKKRNNSTVDNISQRPHKDSLGKQKVDSVEAGSSSNQQPVLNSTNEFDQHNDRIDLDSSNNDQDAAKRAENGTVDAPPSVVEEHSSEELKRKQLSDNQESYSSSNQVVNSSYEPDQTIQNDPRSSTEFSGHEDPESSPEATAHNRIDQEQVEEQTQSHEDSGDKQENVTVVELENSSGKEITEQLSDGNETVNKYAHLFLVNPMIELDRNNDRSSSELSYHDDPESSPEATVNTSVKQHETEFVSSRKEPEIEAISSDFEETVANTRLISDSDRGSNSIDKRLKKAVYLDEEELLSEDGSSDLHRPPRFSRFSSVESTETARPCGISYYGYEGSVSSYDGNDDKNPRRNHNGSVRDAEHVDSGNRYRFNRRNDQPLNGVRSLYGLNEFHENLRRRPYMMSENLKMERTELLKLVRELQDQLERTNISNPQQLPSYYNHVLNNAQRYGQRMAFSGEATAVNRHHSCPQDRHFSAQLPSHHLCCNGPHIYGPNSYRSSRFSGPSSPKHIHSESGFSTADEYFQQNDVRKPFRSPKKKRYVRPVAGGSPWIMCYRCFKLLELPQSFLLFKKKYHSLKCGACMKVLNFTLSDGTHVSRYYPEQTAAAPPSSEAEDNDKLGGSWAGPVSCSDRSFEKSYSTETDRNGSRSREMSEERRKVTMSRDPSGSTQPPSSRVSGRRTTTSEIEEVEPVRNGSPLHWLMGYASPSKVIRGL